MIDPGQQARRPGLAVRRNAPDRDAAEAHPVIGALAPDEARARTFAAHPMPGEGDLQRRIDGLGAGVGEEHVVEPGGRDLHQRVGEREGRRMRELKRWRVVERLELLRDGLRDLRTPVSGVDAPQPRHRIEDLPPLGRPVVHALGSREQPRLGLELTVGCERKPERLQIGAA